MKTRTKIGGSIALGLGLLTTATALGVRSAYQKMRPFDQATEALTAPPPPPENTIRMPLVDYKQPFNVCLQDDTRMKITLRQRTYVVGDISPQQKKEIETLVDRYAAAVQGILRRELAPTTLQQQGSIYYASLRPKFQEAHDQLEAAARKLSLNKALLVIDPMSISEAKAFPGECRNGAPQSDVVLRNIL